MDNVTGSLIRAEIKEQGRTAKWVGEKLGLSEPVMSQRLSGISRFSYSEISQIKKILGLPIDWFGVSEQQELEILTLFHKGKDDLDEISEHVNASLAQVSGVLIYHLKSSVK